MSYFSATLFFSGISGLVAHAGRHNKFLGSGHQLAGWDLSAPQSLLQHATAVAISFTVVNSEVASDLLRAKIPPPKRRQSRDSSILNVVP